MNENDCQACAEACGVSIEFREGEALLAGQPVQCLRLSADAASGIEAALDDAGISPLAMADADGMRTLLLDRGQALREPLSAEGPGSLDALGQQAANWQARHPASAMPDATGYRRGVLQQLLRERADSLGQTLSADERETLDAELRHQSLYRFEDLPLAGSYWHSVRVYPDGAGPADLVMPPAPVPAFWQLARIALALAVDEAGEIRGDAYRALLAGYHARRPLAAIERGAAPTLLRLAALEDWIARRESGAAGESERQRLVALQGHAARVQGLWVRAA
ncbi:MULTISPECIES: hypothetical protein [unclassified Thioalkalivibrio]|uniref:hypothetical protein n=1 Tax=unclassified Thioalkalivibrio TaxID=2621013 RepID=UPI00037FE288|nr:MULTISPECIES: hypothetical protein [unclassified Thioalkalivibrio]